MRLLPTWSNFSWNSACHQFWNSNGLCFMAMDYYASWHWTTPLHQSKSIINTPQPIWGLLINEAVSPAKTHCPTCWPDFRVELAQSVWTGLLVLLFHPTVKWYLFLQDAHIYIFYVRWQVLDPFYEWIMPHAKGLGTNRPQSWYGYKLFLALTVTVSDSGAPSLVFLPNCATYTVNHDLPTC